MKGTGRAEPSALSDLDRVIHTDKGGIRELLTAPLYDHRRTARELLWLRPTATRFAPVNRPRGQGIGLLAQGSLLAERSQSFNSSPTRRGILIRQKLLCLGIPEQPAVVPELPGPGMGWRTTRQRFETSHAQAACAACHRSFNPIGFPLEHFDEGGRFRQSENGEPIDPSGHALGADGQILLTVTDGEEDLSNILAGRPEVAACVVETSSKYLTSQNQNCVAGEARNEFVEGKIGFWNSCPDWPQLPIFPNDAGKKYGAPFGSQGRDRDVVEIDHRRGGRHPDPGATHRPLHPGSGGGGNA